MSLSMIVFENVEPTPDPEAVKVVFKMEFSAAGLMRCARGHREKLDTPKANAEANEWEGEAKKRFAIAEELAKDFGIDILVIREMVLKDAIETFGYDKGSYPYTEFAD